VFCGMVFVGIVLQYVAFGTWHRVLVEEFANCSCFPLQRTTIWIARDFSQKPGFCHALPENSQNPECPRLARGMLTLAATDDELSKLKMPQARPGDAYARRYGRRTLETQNATGLPGGELRSSLQTATALKAKRHGLTPSIARKLRWQHGHRATSVKLHRASRWHRGGVGASVV